MRTTFLVAGLFVGLIAASFAIGACGTTEAPIEPAGHRVDFSRAAGYTVASPDGSVDVMLVSREGQPLAAGRWEATTRSLEWTFEEGAAGGLSFERFAPTEDGVAALVYAQWTATHPEPSVTCGSDGTCTTQQALLCEFNCMAWTGDSYATCWCGCNPSGHSCSYGCC